MSKEVRFTVMSMSNRLSARSEVRYSVHKTDPIIPAYLRKKGLEGKRRTHQLTNPPNTSV